MTHTILVEKKSHFGRIDIYPIDDNALLFASLTGKKTLSYGDIETIKALGYTVLNKQTEQETL